MCVRSLRTHIKIFRTIFIIAGFPVFIISSFVNGACHLFNLWWRGRRSDPTYFLINIIIYGQRVKLYVGIVNQSGFYYKRPLVVGKSFEGDIASHGLHEFAA